MTVPMRQKLSPPPPLLSAALFVIAVVGIGLVVGFATRPGQWYDNLAKPSFNPPPWIFAPVWTVLYVLIALAGWRIWRAAPRSALMGLWVVQMILNWLWSPVFFGTEAPWLALAIIVAMLATILLFIMHALKDDRVSAWLFLPYAAWVAFATVLNGSIAAMN